MNALPPNGVLVTAPRFPKRLSKKAVRRFHRILDTHGLEGRFIVPDNALEEAIRVARREKRTYGTALEVIRAISDDPDVALWNAFQFESLSQPILECFIQLYEAITLQITARHNWPPFGDMLVLAHALYNGCPVASQEWFEKQEWSDVAQVFPYLELPR